MIYKKERFGFSSVRKRIFVHIHLLVTPTQYAMQHQRPYIAKQHLSLSDAGWGAVYKSHC